jgi:signal transduction histidine kinase
MTEAAAPDARRPRSVRRSRSARTALDLLLALACTGAAVGLHRAHIDGVEANRPSDALSTLLTIVAVAPLAARRVRPLAVLVACTTGLLGLIAGEYVVAVAPVGVIIAFYSVAAWGTRRAARVAVGVVAAGLATTAVLRPVDLSLEGIVVNGVLLGVSWVLGTGVRERRVLHEAQVGATLQELDLQRERADRAAVEERLRISRELHDVLGHAMSVMVVQAGVAQHLLRTRPDQAADALTRISDTGRNSLEELRRLLTVIREGDQPVRPHDDLPGLSALPALAAEVTAAGLPVRLTCDVEGVLPDGVALATYRIVQEALTNTLRHAGPTTATVAVWRTGTELRIEVTDDGRGAAEPQGEPGRGLAGMRERVAVYGGEITTGPGEHGYRVHARIPLHALPAQRSVAGSPARGSVQS